MLVRQYCSFINSNSFSNFNKFFGIIFPLLLASCFAWMPDTSTKLVNPFKSVSSVSFTGNDTYPDHFTVLDQDESSIILGGRNRIYNLSVHDFAERVENRIDWPSSEFYSQLCILKGKTENECQNYIRILYHPTAEKLVACGTNSYKPYCRTYIKNNEKYVVDSEADGIGICPFNPKYNSTAVYYNGQLFSATTVDYSGGEPLIYREPQRTEPYDLKQLNGPNFVSSLAFGEHVLFFYRETAVEYMNCGKVIYSRVARVCKDDKGGPHQSKKGWTSFLKARLNCSMPGEYPFYFDEIQSTSHVIEGRYNTDTSRKVIYGVFTTPTNAIGASAICAYQMDEVQRVFDGSFKHQETINSNWLPIPDGKVPEPRPGQCVKDSRLLPDKNVNFIKTHALMEDAVPTLFGKPVLVRVSLQYRFTAIAVDAQVRTVDNQYYDILYIGTDDGKIFKCVNIPFADTAKVSVISENSVLAHNAAVIQVKLTPEYGKIIVIGRDEVRLTTLNHCSEKTLCSDCVDLQDPHCAWDAKQSLCVSIDSVSSYRFLIQDVQKGDTSKCWPSSDKKSTEPVKIDVEQELNQHSFDNSNKGNSIDPLLLDNSRNNQNTNLGGDDCDPTSTNSIQGCAIKQRLTMYASSTLQFVVVVSSIVCLFLGFIAGYWVSRRFQRASPYPDAPFIEQHNRLDRNCPSSGGYLQPRINKSVNLVQNAPSNSPKPPKKDNLDIGKDLNISSDGTLQKIKKTYI